MLKFIKLYVRLWSKHQIQMRAAALTYTFILGVVPAIAVCLSIFSFFVDIKQRQSQLRIFLLHNLSTGTGGEITKYLENFIQNVRFRTVGFIGFMALLVTSLLLLSTIESSINNIWSIRATKKIWNRVLTYNLILIGGPICLSFSIIVTAFVSKFAPQFWIQAHLGSVIINTIFLSSIYKIFPNRKVSTSAALISGFVATIAGELARLAYARYTAEVLLYNKLYGSLAALPLFLIWIYLNWMIFLGGVLLNYMLQYRKSFKTRGPVSDEK